MSGWGDLTSLAKSALSTAQKVQKKIDRVLDIQTDPDSLHGAKGLQDDFLTAFGLSSSQSEADISRDLSQLDDTTSAASIFEDVKAKLKIPKVTGNSGWTTWLPATPQSADTVGAEKELPSDPISVNSTTNNFGAQSDDMVAADDVLTSWTNDGWNEVELTASNVTATPSLPSEVPQWPEAALNLSSVISPSFETDLSTNSSLSASLLANSNLLTSSSLSSDLSNSTIAFTPSNAVDVAEETNVCDTFGSEGSSEQPTGLPSSELDRSDVEILLRGVVERVEDLQKSSQTASDSRDLRIILPANAPAVPQVAGTTTVSNETRMTVDCSEAESKSQEEFAVSPTSSNEGESPLAEGSDDSCGGRNDGSGSTAGSLAFDIQKESGSTGFTSPMEEVDLASMSDDIEILSRCTTTPNGSERGSIRSGFVFTPASINLPSVSGAHLEETDSTASLLPLKRHLASIQLALGTSQQPSKTEKTKKHRRVNSDQMGKESLRTILSGISMELTADETIEKLSKCLSAREQKLLSVSQENAKLTDENEQFRRELELLKAQNSLGGITDLEAKYVNLCEEKEAMKRKCDSLQKELVSRVSSQQFQHMMKEKEEQIQQLLEEGQKLSKKEFQQASVIKKLREKEKEAERLLEAQKGKLKEMEEMRGKLADSEQQLSKYEDFVAKMESAAERSEKKMAKLQAEMLESGEKLSSYKTTLERCYKEIAELNKEKVARQTEVEEMRRQAESSDREEMRLALEKTAAERDGERMRLAQQLEGLRLSLTQAAQDHSRKEDSLRWEIGRLQKQLQEADSRNESLSESATTATRPLLRQIESLQNSFKTQQENWERLEKSLYDRITEAEAKANMASQNEKSTTAETVELRTRLRTAEAQISSLTLEKNRATAESALLRKEIEKITDENKRLERELDAERNLQRQAVAELKKEKELLNAQMEFDAVQTRSQFEMKLKDLQIAIEEKDKLLSSARNQLLDQQVNFQSPPITSGLQIITSPMNLDGSQQFIRRISSFEDSNEELWKNSELSGSSFSTLLENLRAKLQQRDGDVTNLRSEIKRLLHSRDQLTSQLTSLSSHVQTLEGQLENLESVKAEHMELTTSHQALLQLYGEKVEQNEELKLDLEDVKVMYRQQIEDLLAKLSN